MLNCVLAKQNAEIALLSTSKLHKTLLNLTLHIFIFYDPVIGPFLRRFITFMK